MSLTYRVVRAAWRAALFGFFSRIDMEGAERVPTDGPVLLLPNHTNAFVDPLLVLTRLRRPVTLTAKSTLRGNPLLRPLIRALDVVEFHRRSDVELGADPGRNADAIDDVVRRLAGGAAVCLFPEGVSHSDPAMRPFHTGAARIALEAERRGHGAPPVRIVPVGLHYDRKDRFRTGAAVVFGPPLDVRAWVAAHPGGDVHALTEEVERRVRELTVNAAAARRSDALRFAAELLRAPGAPPAPLGLEPARPTEAAVQIVHEVQDTAARLVEREPERVAAIERRVTALRRRLAALRVAPAELYLPLGRARAAFFVLRELELTLVGLPLAAWGWLNHLPAYATVRWLVRRLSRDADHVASNAVFLGIPIFLTFYLIQIAMAFFVLPAGAAAVYALSLPYGGAVALLYRDRIGGIRRRVWTYLLFLRRPALRRALQEEAESIMAEMRSAAEAARGEAGARV